MDILPHKNITLIQNVRVLVNNGVGVEGVISALLDWATGGYWSAVLLALGWLKGFANSNFMSALAGAGIGAYTAQWIADRSERRRTLLAELRATNASIMIAFALTNAYCSLKSQQVVGIATRYKELLDRLNAVYALQTRSADTPPVFEFEADLRTVNVPATQVDTLGELLFEKVSPPGRALLAYTSLVYAIQGLAQAADMRNSIIADLRKNPNNHVGSLARTYFGIADQHGHVDANFRDCVVAIKSQTDDCIFFSKTLMEDLVRQGNKLAKQLGGAARVPEPDFSKASANGLIPDDKQYADWLSGHREQSVSQSHLSLVGWLLRADWG